MVYADMALEEMRIRLMSKFINISPHRSGTQSFTKFCTDHGLSAVHWMGDDIDIIAKDVLDSRVVWDNIKHILNEYDVFSDLPWPSVYPHVFAEYEDSEFILVKRIPDNWLKSIRIHTKDRSLSYQEKIFYNNICGYYSETLDEYSNELLVDSYNKFVANSIDLLKSKLHVFDLEDEQLPNKVADLLGFVPVHQYGHLT
jgi:hypothetical protein